MRNAIKKTIRSVLKGKVYFNKPLRSLTYFKIGGVVKLWIEPVDLEDLKEAVDICNKLKLPIFLLGNGSNLLANDKDIKKAVIRLSAPFFKKIEFCNDKVSCGSGVLLPELISSSMENGLGGLEFLAGVPASVGGAVAMNAGNLKDSIGKYIEWIKVMDYHGRLREFKKEKLKFMYRKSNISGKIILQVGFKLKKSKPCILEEKLNKILHKKKNVQVWNYPNAGCVFKNLPSSKLTAGQLIESAGLKGKRIGDAQFSEVHANFIINRGKAKFKDVESLMKLAQKEVKKKFNLWLEPEIKILK